MSMVRLDILSKKGGILITIEIVLVFSLVTVGYLLALEPILQSIAPDTYAQSGLKYTERALPTTMSTVTHAVLIVLLNGGHLFWRLNRTELGNKLTDEFEEDM
jgi:amino acid permease